MFSDDIPILQLETFYSAKIKLYTSIQLVVARAQDIGCCGPNSVCVARRDNPCHQTPDTGIHMIHQVRSGRGSV